MNATYDPNWDNLPQSVRERITGLEAEVWTWKSRFDISEQQSGSNRSCA